MFAISSFLYEYIEYIVKINFLSRIQIKNKLIFVVFKILNE